MAGHAELEGTDDVCPQNLVPNRAFDDIVRICTRSAIEGSELCLFLMLAILSTGLPGGWPRAVPISAPTLHCLLVSRRTVEWTYQLRRELVIVD
jgi:hypothetical protein